MEICACRLIFPPHPLYPCFTNQKSHKKTAPKKGAAFKEPFITTTHHGHYITQRKILSPPLRTTVRAARSPHALSAEQGVLSPTSNHSQGGENRCRAPPKGRLQKIVARGAEMSKNRSDLAPRFSGGVGREDFMSLGQQRPALFSPS